MLDGIVVSNGILLVLHEHSAPPRRAAYAKRWSCRRTRCGRFSDVDRNGARPRADVPRRRRHSGQSAGTRRDRRLRPRALTLVLVPTVYTSSRGLSGLFRKKAEAHVEA